MEERAIEFSEETLRNIARAMEALDRKMREETAIDMVEQDIARELEKDARSMDYGRLCPKLDVEVNHAGVTEEAKDLYDETMSSVEEVAKIASRRVLPFLKKQKDNDLAMSGFFSGSRFDATRLVANDWRYFRQNMSPQPDKRLAVSLLVDESGSMSCPIERGSCVSRADCARAAAIALYLFCQQCDIKTSVIGHTCDFGNKTPLELMHYTDFDSPSKDDKYRLMGISAKRDNRDGPAIRFAGEHLLKRAEPTKIMFIISDGAPCADGYIGTPAENDMSAVVADLRRRGVIIFAAAIGNDKEAIQRIYGEGFIDITNLATLPDQLVDMVRRYVK